MRIENVAIGKPDDLFVLEALEIVRLGRSPYRLADGGRREIAERLRRPPCHPEDARGLEALEVDPFDLVGSQPEEEVVQSDVHRRPPPWLHWGQSVGEDRKLHRVQPGYVQVADGGSHDLTVHLS